MKKLSLWLSVKVWEMEHSCADVIKGSKEVVGVLEVFKMYIL